MKDFIRLRFANTRTVMFVKLHRQTDRVTVEMHEWRKDPKKGSMARYVPVDTSALQLDLMFMGPERHLRPRVPGKPKPLDALCGKDLSGFRSSAPHRDQGVEVDRLQTVCSECSALLERMV